MYDNVVCIIQARMGSERLSGKVMKNLSGKHMIEHVVERVNHSNEINDVIVATSLESSNDPMVELLNKKGIRVFRGSEEDVLERYYLAAKESKAEVVVRITGDCPLIDPGLIDSVIKYFKENEYDYISPRSKDGLIRGLDVEVFKFQALEQAYLKSSDKLSREHVTYYMYSNEDEFCIKGYPVPERFINPNIRLCVDEINDFKLIEAIYAKLYTAGNIINIENVLELYDTDEGIFEINKNVIQKKV